MNTIKYWEIESVANDIIATNDIKLFLDEVSKGASFKVKDKRMPNEPGITMIDMFYDDSIMEYTSLENPIMLSKNNNMYPNIINPECYEKYKNLIVDKKLEYFYNIGEAKLNSDIYTNHLLIVLLNDEKINKIFINDVNLNDEEMKLVINSKKNVYIKNDTTDRAFGADGMFGNNSLSVLQVGTVELDKEFLECDYENLIHATEKTRFKIEIKDDTPSNMLDLMTRNLEKVVNILGEHAIESKIVIYIKNKKLVTSDIHRILKKHKNSFISSERELLYDKYMEVNRYLEHLVKGALDKGYSPLEKYLYLYNIAKQFKEYKENTDDVWDSRDIDRFLFNEYMVCVGFSTLLKELLDLAGIESSFYSVEVDTSYDDYEEDEVVEEQEGKVLNYEGHARLLVHMKDEKYNIDAYYQADPTWDNVMKYDSYQHALCTMSSSRYTSRLFSLSNTDLLLDFDSIEDFYNKINHYLNRNQVYKDNNTSFEMFSYGVDDDKLENSKDVDIIRSYELLCIEMLNLIESIDLSLYNELSKESLKIETEEDYKMFISLFGEKVLIKTNKEIEKDTLYTAVYNMKVKQDENITMDDINLIRNFNEERELLSFPYKK